MTPTNIVEVAVVLLPVTGHQYFPYRYPETPAESESPMRYVFDVRSPLLFPVLAKAGDVLVVEPGTDTPILVVKRGTSEVIREGPPNYGALIPLLLDGVISERVLSPDEVLQRLSA